MSCAIPQKILTPRLALIPIAPAMLHAEQTGDNLAQLIDAEIPTNWPPADWEPHVFTTLLALYEQFPSHIAFHRYIAIQNPNHTRTLIGTLGAFRHEAQPAEREIGYTILPPWEGRGLATEATLALIDLIRQDPTVTSIVAHTFPHLAASIRIMEKCGLRLEGPGTEPGTLRYRLRL